MDPTTAPTWIEHFDVITWLLGAGATGIVYLGKRGIESTLAEIKDSIGEVKTDVKCLNDRVLGPNGLNEQFLQLRAEHNLRHDGNLYRRRDDVSPLGFDSQG